LVILEGGGALICRELAAGEVLRASGGNLVAFEESVQFSVDMVKARVLSEMQSVCLC
jgi:uncharacterized protein (AIM24 family)